MPEAQPVPGATYRVQLHAGFGFEDAAGLAGYLADLGVTHLYCSPILQAAAGSTHGYDVVDHSHLSADLGGAEAFGRLADELGRRGLGLVVDIVPNHMATAGRANAWWWEVLEDGPSSLYAGYFDIDWDPPEAKLRQRVLVPILGDHYGRVLERGELRLCRRDSEFTVAYFEHEAPLSPRTLDELLADAAGSAGASAEVLGALARAFGGLPLASATDRDSVAQRHRDKHRLSGELEALLREQPDAARALDGVLDRVNADPDRLDALLQRQNYRLAHWRVAGAELDYRRFFDVPGLIGLRVEQPVVFEDTHRLILELVRSGRVDGLRVDHPDGLRDPGGYLRRLREASGGTWMVVEKILEGDESLPEDWVAAGTTGYEFLNLAGGLFIDPAGEMAMTELYRGLTGDTDSFEETALTAKREIMASSLATDVERLTAAFVEVCETRRRFRDFTRPELRDCLRETLAAMPVYRTYVEAGGRAGTEDAERIRSAVELARSRRTELDPELFELLEGILLGRHRAPVDIELAQRFQQLSGPVMAKGVEDTAFYRYARLLALNEVGGDPARFGVEAEAFHRHNAMVQDRWPMTLLATSTHDTKRSEDVRTRLALLSEMPSEWGDAVRRWSELAARHRREGFTDPRAEYVLFQTMVGAHPIGSDRLVDYMLKATREAKLATSWTQPDEGYEAAMTKLVEGLCGDPDFTSDLDAFVSGLVEPGRVNSLALVTLKLTSPGVPDIYQGTEGWDLSLVDPDNRRAVDHAGLAGLLSEVGSASAPSFGPGGDGAAKLFLIQRLLRLRAAEPASFSAGSTYSPLWATGPRAQHALAYLRGERVAVVVPRLVLGLARSGGWAGTSLGLPAGDWVDCLTGAAWSGPAPVELAGLLDQFPVAVLVRR
ncbi:MAG: malto-oligosyltrehalose synthase [Acidimicrobiales bacterium]